MTQYRTNNPLGSMAPRDLYDNAQNIDNWSNGEEPFYEDRFGVMRRSFSGMNFEFEAAQDGRTAAFDAQMAALGYVSKGAYAAGIVLETYSEYIAVPGVVSGGTPAFYRPGPNAELPLTLEGDWAIDGPLLTQMDSDDVLRQELAAPGGGQLVRLGDSTVDALTSGGGAELVGYIDRTVGARLADVSSVKDGGATGDGATDDAPAFQSAIDADGRAVYIPNGAYRWESGVTIDYSDAAFPNEALPSLRTSLVGESLGNTIINYAGSTGFAITKKGPVSFANFGVHANDTLENFVLNSEGFGQTRLGIFSQNLAFGDYKNLNLNYFDTAMVFDSCLSSKFDHVFWSHNKVGLVMDNTTGQSFPNANTFDNCQFNSNSQAGILGNIVGATNRFTSSRFESNGQLGVNGTGGVIMNLTGGNGTACLVFESCYFENNGGEADLFLTNVSNLPLTVVIVGSTFNRGSSAKYTKSNITLLNTGGGTIKCVMIGCGFYSTGSYVPDASRPFVSAGSGCEVIDIGCTYSESISRGGVKVAALTERSSKLAPNSTPTSIYTLPNLSTPAVYSVAVNVGTANDAVNFGASAVVLTDGPSARMVNISNATLQTISLSGLDIISQQTSGSSQTVGVTVTKIG